MSDEQTDLLRALASMVHQYLDRDGVVDHICLSAGEEAVEQLIKHGILEPRHRGGVWTEAGRALLG